MEESKLQAITTVNKHMKQKTFNFFELGEPVDLDENTSKSSRRKVDRVGSIQVFGAESSKFQSDKEDLSPGISPTITWGTLAQLGKKQKSPSKTGEESFGIKLLNESGAAMNMKKEFEKRVLR